MGLNSVGLLFLLAAALLAWWSTLGARTRARGAARRACEEAGVLFIDELAFKRLRFGRDRRGQPCLKRTYAFEFVVGGERRYAGEVELHAQRVVTVRMDPHPF